jgi:hypothetical protein
LKLNTDRFVLPLTTNRGLILSPEALTQATIVTCVLIALVRPGTLFAPFSAMTFRRQLLTRTGTLVKRLKLKTPFKNSTTGKDWWQKLKQRQSDLIIRKPEKTGTLRCRMMNR